MLELKVVAKLQEEVSYIFVHPNLYKNQFDMENLELLTVEELIDSMNKYLKDNLMEEVSAHVDALHAMNFISDRAVVGSMLALRKNLPFSSLEDLLPLETKTNPVAPQMTLNNR
ncbi:hypothetical protein FEM48_Zijuj10G0078400 [Ziziphus jujuba var. spinosa]|uniref:Uncharacterized protein n=1 Tax=Ziziphus jujuba var. spinosa TaxID=714518 RepID=A0A978UM58_ZIZJJ|nr:hypothetical protein FEM48_Zijuj10G0078400 [Ziziphus jujuba var. spinosa]